MSTFFRLEHLRRTVTDSSARNLADAWPRSAGLTHIFFESGPRPTSGVSLFVSGFYRAGLRAVVRDHILILMESILWMFAGCMVAARKVSRASPRAGKTRTAYSGALGGKYKTPNPLQKKSHIVGGWESQKKVL